MVKGGSSVLNYGYEMRREKIMKKNNSGFSLVELIVVVLIMAIIAVALAPQIVKWIENSRIANDIQTRNTLKSDCELALTEQAAFNVVKDGGYVITVTKDDSGVTTYCYDDKTGHDITPDPTDPYWASLLKVSGCSSFSDFQDSLKLKSSVGEGSIILKVKIYESGHTVASLMGITGNDDIEVSSETFPDEVT